MGTIHEDKTHKIQEQIYDEKKIRIRTSPQDYSTIWKDGSAAIKAADVSVPQMHRCLYEFIQPGDSLRMHLTLRQSTGTGAAGITIVTEAMKDFPQSPAWRWAAVVLPDELLTNYQQQAAAALATNTYIGYGTMNETDLIKNTKFSNLYYLVRKLLKVIGGDQNIGKIQAHGVVKKKVVIDQLIEALKNEALEELDLDDFRFAAQDNIGNLIPIFDNLAIMPSFRP